MELNGTLSNREVLFETSGLVRLKHRLLQGVIGSVLAPAPPRQRAGRIKQTVVDVLDVAPGPLRVSEIRRACEQRLGVSVNRSTVSDCLIKHSRGDGRLFDQGARGCYRRHSDLAAPRVRATGRDRPKPETLPLS